MRIVAQQHQPATAQRRQRDRPPAGQEFVGPEQHPLTLDEQPAVRQRDLLGRPAQGQIQVPIQQAVLQPVLVTLPHLQLDPRQLGGEYTERGRHPCGGCRWDQSEPQAAGLPVRDFPDPPAQPVRAGDHLGWRPVECGPLANALHLEHLTLLWIKMPREKGRGPGFVWVLLER